MSAAKVMFSAGCLLFVSLIHAAEPSTPSTKSFIYKKTKQADLSLIVHFPADATPDAKRPAIVFFFGGGWNRGTIKQFESQAKHFAARGMVAVRADYRVKSRHNVLPDACVEDAKSAVRWIREHAESLGVDPDRIVASGGSAGGHLAACTGLIAGFEASGENREISSRSNVLVLYNPVLKFADVPRLISRLDGDVELARKISPTLFINKQTPPTLILFGSNDRLLAQGEEYLNELKKVDGRGEMMIAEDQKHGFFNRSPWLKKTTQRVDDFLVSLGYLESI